MSHSAMADIRLADVEQLLAHPSRWPSFPPAIEARFEAEPAFPAAGI